MNGTNKTFLGTNHNRNERTPKFYVSENAADRLGSHAVKKHDLLCFLHRALHRWAGPSGRALQRYGAGWRELTSSFPFS
jgi:hypothetical protein